MLFKIVIIIANLFTVNQSPNYFSSIIYFLILFTVVEAGAFIAYKLGLIEHKQVSFPIESLS